MKLRPVTKLDKRNETTSKKKFDDDILSKNCGVITIFPSYSQFGAIQKPDSGRIVCKTIFLTVTFYLTKTENRNKNEPPQSETLKSRKFFKILLRTFFLFRSAIIWSDSDKLIMCIMFSIGAKF